MAIGVVSHSPTLGAAIIIGIGALLDIVEGDATQAWEVAVQWLVFGGGGSQSPRLVLGVHDIRLFLVGAHRFVGHHGHGIGADTQHIRICPQGHAYPFVAQAVDRQIHDLQWLGGASRGWQAPVGRPSGHGRVAIDHLVALQVGVFEVVQLLEAQGLDHGIPLQVAQLVEGSLETATVQAGHGSTGRSPVGRSHDIDRVRAR